MATFSYAQLEDLWIKAGGPRALAPLMAAVALAESDGNSDAHNPSGATGLWQILGNPGPGNAYDPLTNAKFAVAKYHEQGLGAWTTYTSGAYKKFMRGNVPPAAAQTTAATGDVSGLQQFTALVPGFGIPLSFLFGTANGI